MTDHTKTINISIRALGIGATSRWGTMVWGSDKWGEGSIPVQTYKFTAVAINNVVNTTIEIVKYVTKGIFNTQGTDSAVIKIPYKFVDSATTVSSEIGQKNATKVLDNDVPVVTDLAKEASMTFSEAIAATEELDSVKIFDNAGYVDEFPGGKEDAIGRIWDNWSKATPSSDNSSATTDPVTTWSEA
jgi:hypothetical protein